MKINKYYTKKYYQQFTESTIISASEVIPLILNYIKPYSVVDIGCGLGAWLSIWKKNGVKSITGVDGHHIEKSDLIIDTSEFLYIDLFDEFELSIKYDLACSLEVAEHIPENKAEGFIKSICKSSDIILFSAAIPNQEGLLHINEQYPAYWINLFKKFDFYAFDLFRNKIWLNKKINSYYRQNLLLFANKEGINKIGEEKLIKSEILPLVHPDLFEEKAFELNIHRKALKTPIHYLFFLTKQVYHYLIHLTNNK